MNGRFFPVAAPRSLAGHLAGHAGRSLVLAAAMGLAACNNTAVKSERAHINNETKFSSKEFGVKGSPRVTESKTVKKGGGRYQVGKPYKIRGKWYTPKEDPTYAAIGKASWYGPNFHGRLTANGEVYDQYHLSAAHPTLPLPSYVRVTNLTNDRSVVVRVNDRGPFAHNRIIDLSKKAAEMLDFKHAGVTNVRVEYVGKARMDGLDQQFLLASYRGPNAPTVVPGATMPGTMLALAGPKRPAPPGTVASDQAFALAMAPVPVPLPRPGYVTAGGIPLPVAGHTPFMTAALAPLSFAAQDRINLRIDSAFAAFDRREPAGSAPVGGSVDIWIAEYAEEAAAWRVAKSLASMGLVAVEPIRQQRQISWAVRMVTGADVAAEIVEKARARGFVHAAIAD